jgi:hypothetical protein
LSRPDRRVFCYFGRFRFSTELDSIVELLPQQEQTAARDLLREAEHLSDDDLKQRFLEVLEADN